jgi:hypothetical protein
MVFVRDGDRPARVRVVREEHDMKKFAPSPEIQRHPRLSALVEGTRPILEDVLGQSAGLVEAEWSLEKDQGRPVLTLKLSDFTYPKGCKQRFTPAELEGGGYLRQDFHRLWGDLLQARLGDIVGTLQGMTQDGAGQ